MDNQEIGTETKLDPNLAGNTEDDQIRSLILANEADSEGYRQTSSIIEDLKAWYNLYRGIPRKKPYEWMSNIFIPMTASKVDTGVSNIIDMTLKGPEPIDVRPTPFGQGDEIHANIIKALVNKQVKGDDFFYKFYSFVKNLVTYGTAIGKVCWDSRPRKLTVANPQYNNILGMLGNVVKSIFTGNQAQNEYTDLSDKPVFEVCNIGDIDHDPQSIEIGDGWVIHKVLRTLDYLKSRVRSENNPYGMYNEEVMKITAADSDEWNEGKQKIEGDNAKQNQPVVKRPTGSVKIKLKEWVGYFPLNGEYQLCILTLAANKYVIRKEPFPYWISENNNYIKGTYIPLANEFYGIGVPELLEDLQNNLNENINQRIDNIQLTLNPMCLYVKNTGVNVSGLVAKPGGVFGMDEKGSISWDRAPDVTNSNFAHTQEIERWAQEVTAITKITQGTAGTDVNRTATGMSILQKSASDRFLLTAKLLEFTSFTKIARMFYELDYQYYDQFKIAQILGINPEDIDMNKMKPHFYEFVPNGIRTMEDKTNKALKLLQAMTVMKDNPDFDMRKASMKFIELLDISDNPEKEFMRSPEQAMALRQAEQVKMMMDMVNKGGPVGSGKGSESTQFNGMVQGAAPGVPPVSQGAMPPPEA